VDRTWQRYLGTLAVGILLATGCVARPAPRPEAPAPRPEAPAARPETPAATPPGQIDPTLSAAAVRSAASVGGAGTVEAIVIGNTALIAIQLNSPNPGGTEGGPLMGRTHGVDYPGTSPSGGPINVQGPGGSVGASPAMPGGGIHPGGATPGGTPSSTQAAPNNGVDVANSGGANRTPLPVPARAGSAPFDVMTRVSDQVRSQNPRIVDVRFATDPGDAIRVATLADAMRAGTITEVDRTELLQLMARAVPAGTTDFDPRRTVPVK